jgi:hypothetical protein
MQPAIDLQEFYYCQKDPEAMANFLYGQHFNHLRQCLDSGSLHLASTECAKITAGMAMAHDKSEAVPYWRSVQDHLKEKLKVV